ncbi:BREX-2 system adenine-specific DNA-methyltransferase PglX [Dermacoccus sp. BD5]|uniref:BREX-2 system adenine-specific DNA-methyltransferase PglX n=1 Tax=Dermacoccus sp. BD5 TaxID=2953656 RepID=UPI00383FB7A6
MPVSSSALTPALKKLVLSTEADLRAWVEADGTTRTAWREAYASAQRANRTSLSWQAWRDDRVTQTAVAWVLMTVFVRFCEDNELLEDTWFTGHGERRQEALDAQLDFARANPMKTDFAWLDSARIALRDVKATSDLVERHSPIHFAQLPGEAAKRIIEFWREQSDDGALVWDFRDDSLDTRFLGDLYQDLSEYAKKTFALLQTPVFVEEFILDQTMEPALAERPLEGFRLIDPTCGSGHFLLGAYARLEQRWAEEDTSLTPEQRAQKALDSVVGVDLNPFAIAIARFRLIVAALQTCGLTSLQNALHFDLNLAAGDSLLYGRDNALVGGAGQGFDGADAVGLFEQGAEDAALLRRLLEPGTYDAVVGNPPYITVKDKVLNERYRALYPTCKGTYALSVPFMERFFDLARTGSPGRPDSGGVAAMEPQERPAGWVGQITSNSFMKREFGSRLIEEFLPRQDLRLVADTSGAYIPGHGTPTVIVVGRHCAPVAGTVRAVLGKRGEPGQPADPARALVWSSIHDQSSNAGFENEYVSVDDIKRSSLKQHPWNLTGGVAPLVVERLNANSGVELAALLDGPVGFASFPGSDDSFFSCDSELRRTVPKSLIKPVVTGDVVRDWDIAEGLSALFPYDDKYDLLALGQSDDWGRRMWPLRTPLGSTTDFDGKTKASSGKPWWGWYRLVARRYKTPLTITFAFVATHNHFVLDRGGKVFKQSAPVIKLPEGATEDQHLELLGVLNSSTACFWLKQNSHNKGDSTDTKGARVTGDPAFDSYEFTGTTLKDFPLPGKLPLERGRRLDSLAQKLAAQTPPALIGHETPTQRMLDTARVAYGVVRERMIAEQEELDWECYRLYGLLDENEVDLTCADAGVEVPRVKLGERAFEIVLGRSMRPANGGARATTDWFRRHGSTPITEIPEHWPAGYRALVQRRLDAIENNPLIRLLEQPEYKRRWAREPWEKQVERALRTWLLDRLEARTYWFDAQGRPVARSVAQLSDRVERDAEVLDVLRLWFERRDASTTEMLVKLLAPEGVPYLAAHRLKDSGLRKYEAWEHTWDLQRREDAGENVGTIPVPPKYTTADFRKTSYWSHRGKLDVPKERFISYPGASRTTDPTELLGWAGWNHAQQALALAGVIAEREDDGWEPEALVPLVAGLVELQPWVRQWYDELDPTFGVNLADFLDEQLRERTAQVGLTPDQLRAWRPAAATRGRRKRTT